MGVSHGSGEKHKFKLVAKSLSKAALAEMAGVELDVGEAVQSCFDSLLQ